MTAPSNPVLTCPCKACEKMRKLYGKDSVLLEFYGKKLLQRGWPGQTDDIERAYRLAHAPGAEARGERLKNRGGMKRKG